jgi:hypothetical protein
MTSDAPSHAPFFIIGNDRSGTTMLRLILDRGAQTALPTESMFLGDFAPVRRRGGLDDHDAAVRFTERVWNHPKVALWELDGEPTPPPVGLSHDEAYRWAIEQPYLAYMRRDGKTRWADKTPYYLEWVDEIKAVFPEAKFIELVRDGRDVGLSIMPLPFGGNNAWVTGRDWARGIRLGQAAHERWPGDVFTVQYEQLTADPAPYIQRMCEFLGMEYSPDMLNVEKTDSSKIVADQAEWFTNLWAGINQKSVGKWKRKMSEKDQAIFLAAAGPELAAHGYEPGAGGVPATVGPVRSAWYLTANFARRLVNLVKLRIFQERGRELRYVVTRRMQRT